jgi:NADP-dependent 3-hydroxy acid dehydrogenase YdfG
LITGCSSGFGKLLSERAFAMGDSVVTTARSTQALAEIGREDESRILRLALDVRDPAQIAEAVDRSIERFGAIDILVNNAGYGYFATQEEGEMEEVRTMFDTNVFGLIAMNQGVLPHMRERRSGTIINISSISGRIATPRSGFYQASKWAVEALSESLYLETSSFGLRVIVIEPGAYETDFDSRSARVAAADKSPLSPYAALRTLWRRRQAEAIFPYRQYPSEVIDAIVEAVDSDLPFVRLPVGRDAREMVDRRTEMKSGFVEWMRKLVHDLPDRKAV